MVWSVVQVVGAQGMTLLIFAVLAVLLNPEDFGVIGMALSWIAFVQAFSELGFGAALIQRQEVTPEHVSTAFFINIAMGIILTLVGIALAWPCALFFKTPTVQPVVAALSLGFLINSFSLTQTAIAQKGLRFRDLAIRDVAASLVGGVVGIVLAWLKFGVWSLVTQFLATSFTATILLWHISKWRPQARNVSIRCAKEIWPYSSQIFMFDVFKYFAQNTDKLLIGYYLGSVALGLYTLAFKIVVTPISVVVGAIGIYLFPKYSRMQSDLKAIRKSYLFVTKAINSTAGPVIVIVVFLVPLVIPSMWGQQWSPATPLVPILGALAMSQSLISPVGQLMKALGQPGGLFIWSVVITLLVALSMWVGMFNWGLVGATFGITAAYILGVPINFLIARRLLQVSLGDILKSLSPSTASTSIMLVSVWLFANHVPSLSALIGGLLLGILIYLTSLRQLDRTFLSTIVNRPAKA